MCVLHKTLLGSDVLGGAGDVHGQRASEVPLLKDDAVKGHFSHEAQSQLKATIFALKVEFNTT